MSESPDQMDPSDSFPSGEVFRVIGNETRLSVLLALWDAYDPDAETNALSFSELYRAVDFDNPGNFSYHLKQLVGYFIRKTDEGYELRRAGLKLVRSIIAGMGVEDLTLAPTLIDKKCQFCGAQAAVAYEDEWLYILCTECEGFYANHDGMPEGALTGMELDPAGVANREPAEMFRAAWTLAVHSLQCAVQGICNECSGSMTCELRICEDHDSDGVCATCGRRFDVMAKFRCEVCKNHHMAPPRTVVASHPAVVAFYHDHGIPSQYETRNFADLAQQKRHVMAQEQELVSTDPVHIEVKVGYLDDELRLTLDEELNVVETARSSAE